MPRLIHVVTRMCCLVALALPAQVVAHGSVTPDADLCIIQIGYLKAHFKIYQPEARGQRDYCEDVPSKGRTIFIMEYEHSDLSTTPVDFRIIKNVTGNGQFANIDDVRMIEDLNAVTVFHHQYDTQPDVFMVEHRFDDTGEFIGVVSVRNEQNDKEYVAVFPFEVGYWGVGYWPAIALVALALQLHYLWMNGWFRRRPPKLHIVRAVSALFVASISLLHPSNVLVAEEGTGTWASRAGHFVASFQSELDPLAINRIHSWTLVVRDAEGRPVSGADIVVSGGMPAHNHGLPTQPRVTEELGNGRYLVEGMRFHMQGEWTVDVVIETDTAKDVVRIGLTL